MRLEAARRCRQRLFAPPRSAAGGSVPRRICGRDRRLGGRLQLSGYPIPVFHKEAWRDGEQSGFFETERADVSANMPAGYRLEFGRASDRAVQGGRGIRAYYRDKSGSYMCFVLAASGRQTRLSLGRPGEDGSILHGALCGLSDGQFTMADLGAPLAGRPAGGRQSAFLHMPTDARCAPSCCGCGLNARPHCEARCGRRERFGAGGGADRTTIVINNTEYHIDEHSTAGAGLKRPAGEPMNRVAFWIEGGSNAGQGGGGESVLDDRPVNLVA